MSVKIRLARWGARKNPYYHIVATDSRSPRDGKFLETIGKYNPMLENNAENKYTLKEDRIKYWLSVGAQPTDKVRSILAKFSIVEKKEIHVQTKKSLPKAKAQEKLKAQQAEIEKKAQAEADAKAQAQAEKQAKIDAEKQAQAEVKSTDEAKPTE